MLYAFYVNIRFQKLRLKMGTESTETGEWQGFKEKARSLPVLQFEGREETDE